MSTMILPCSCYHEAQDKIHGKGKRVKNLTLKNKNEKIYRCTVCLKESQR